MKDFAVFICTHGRPYEQITLDMLRDSGYTGLAILVVDNEDNTRYLLDDYIGRRTDYWTFNKQYHIKTDDSGTNTPIRNTHLYAWNACESFAKDSCIQYYAIMDDDLTSFRYRYEEDGHLKSQTITQNMDKVFDAYIDYLKATDIACLSIADARNYIGGKAKDGRNMNTVIFRNGKHEFKWHSEMYEEMATSITYQQRGDFIFQPTFMQYETKTMAKNVKGGMEEIYKSQSIFRRAAYTVMYHPDCVSFDANNTGFKLKKDNAFPKLIGSKYKLL